jgi:hypothetical protein
MGTGGFPYLAQAGLYECEMKLRRGSRCFRIARKDCIKDGGMLFVEDGHIFCMLIEQIARTMRTGAQKIEDSVHDVHQGDVLGGLGYRHVELSVNFRVPEDVVLAAIFRHQVEDSAQLAAISLGAVYRCMIRSHGLEPMPDLLDVLRCFRMVMKQVNQRISNSRRRHIGDRKAATASRAQDAARF